MRLNPIAAQTANAGMAGTRKRDRPCGPGMITRYRAVASRNNPAFSLMAITVNGNHTQNRHANTAPPMWNHDTAEGSIARKASGAGESSVMGTPLAKVYRKTKGWERTIS